MDYNNKPKGYYNNDRPEMLKYLPEHTTRVLDIGCSDGSFGKMIKDEIKAEVWGIEYRQEEALKAGKVLDNIFSGPCEKLIDELPDNFFDVIYFNDILEHLEDPYNVLKEVKSKLKKEGVIISSIPNIRYYKAILSLIFNKDWKYKAQGVMDKTHLRFFTGKSIKRMFEDLGYNVLTHEGINRSSSIRPIIFNIPFLFTQMDIRYLQYATVAGK